VKMPFIGTLLLFAAAALSVGVSFSSLWRG
jgi:hypothetical protein